MSSTRTLSRKLSVVLVALVCLYSAAAEAQTVTQAGVAVPTYTCETNPVAAGSYDACALTYSHGLLKRGEKKQIVAKSGLLHPVRLSAFVTGDSSLFYANRFEHLQSWTQRIIFPGAGLITASLIGRYACHGQFCDGHSHRSLNITAGVGVALIAVGVPFRVKASHAAQKSIQLYNAILGH